MGNNSSTIMKILYDSQAFSQTYGGISKSFCELIKNLPSDIKWEIAIKQSNNIHLKQMNLVPNLQHPQISLDNFITRQKFKGKSRLYNLCNKIFPNLPTPEHINRRLEIELLKQGNFDIFHPTFFDDYYLPLLAKKPFVLTIHDMMPELFPQYFKQNDLQIINKRKLVKEAAAIVAVSKKTKEDVINILGVNPENITVIYHGGPSINTHLLYESPIIKGKYILYVGNRTAYKNFKQLLEGFALFVQNFSDIKLVCTGPKFSQEELKLIHEKNLSQKVKHYFANDTEIGNLYAHALTFVYPSLYEGFGMPILEAYAYGCPVFLSKCSCFPEIAGNAAIYYDTQIGEKDIASKLSMLYQLNSTERQSLINAGYHQLSLYSWKKSAKKLAELYKEILT